ncbi:MAG TPA: sigma-54 dependent transcriptional regulator [Nitrospiria bacterium]|jgi:DNA-binding NtrC family response regulator
MSGRILIVDDDPDIRLTLRDRLVGQGYRVFEANSCAEMRELFNHHEFDLVLLDLQLPDGDGLKMLDEMTHLRESTEIIMISAFGTIPKAVEAMRKGITDFVAKPFDFLDIETRIKKSLDFRRLKREAEGFQTERLRRPKLVPGKSKAMKECLDVCQRIAPTDTTVLLLGETGTGKEVLAHHIHGNSSRANKPFVVISCTNFSENLVEDELFGHEQGAFTGANKFRQGKVELADEGTLFFDEIGELPRELQCKLLRFLEHKTYTRVGGNKERETDVRLIAASNRDLATEVRKGNFREDLFYRLNVYPILLPPLRDRIEDIPDLANHFLKEVSTKQCRNASNIDEKALGVLKSYHWPGNIRELRNVIERATVLANNGTIQPQHLFPLETSGKSNVSKSCGSLKEKVEQFEKSLIFSALEETNWNKAEAARRLEINRTHFFRLLDRYNIQSKNSKQTFH